MKKIILGLAATALLSAGCISEAKTQIQNSPQQSGTPALNQYTMAEVSKASSIAKCWTVINGQVYDLTKFIARHPGGSQAILSLCGTDGTQRFMQQHGNQSHPEQELATLLIGTLKN